MTNKTDLEILADAPELDDLVTDITGAYFDAYGNYLTPRGVWGQSDASPVHPRSLVDIKALVAKDKKIEELEKFISENTPLLSYLAIETVSSSVDGDPLFRFKDWLAKRDLEQKAKGAEDIIESVLGEPESLTNDALSIRYEFLDRAKQLHEQAKGGKS